MEDFIPGFGSPPGTRDSDVCFLFSGARLLVKDGEQIKIPSRSDLEAARIPVRNQLLIGRFGKSRCIGCDMPEVFDIRADGMELRGLRGLFGNLDDRTFSIASLGLQVLNWDRVSRFCGACGTPIQFGKIDRAKKCSKCGLVEFPRINPVVIVAVTRNREILLVKTLRKSSLHSVIAGYVELGETLEQAAEREIREETGIRVKDIRYFGSQPWPFSNALMAAFTANYAGGEIRPQENEIAEAGWFTADSLPPIPGWGSVARRLIDDFVKKQNLKGQS